ncbi:hypothetical protein [Devosia sp. Naph2]|uniref:hypothetical protein n=1 Tax=Devosia polycyclovorans TaxID=3345148 RepID=UPI0035CF6E35
MTRSIALRFAGLLAFSALAMPAQSQGDICVDCISVRVGPPLVVRGPFPDELDATFAAIRLPDGTFRGFSANGATYAVDGASLPDMGGPRRAVLEPGEPGSINDCGRWLTSTVRSEGALVGFVHQERMCDYDVGRTDKTMAIATSTDDGLTWTDLGTVIAGTDSPLPDRITGEGDCSLVDGHDGFLYAYCLRNTDWQTIVARAPTRLLTDWRKYHEGAWREPGLGGAATDIGFVGTGAGYLVDEGWIAAVATDPWFGGLRLSLSPDMVNFVDLDEPLVPIDAAEWSRPAPTDLSVYASLVNPERGGNDLGNQFMLTYVFIPAGAGFESRYLVQREVALSTDAGPDLAQVGIALSRWRDPETDRFVSATGPVVGNGRAYDFETTVAYALTRASDSAASVKLVECSSASSATASNMLAQEGHCAQQGMEDGRTAGWLLASGHAGTVPVHRCRASSGQSFISGAPDCEGLGTLDVILGYGFAP